MSDHQRTRHDDEHENEAAPDRVTPMWPQRGSIPVPRPRTTRPPLPSAPPPSRLARRMAQATLVDEEEPPSTLRRVRRMDQIVDDEPPSALRHALLPAVPALAALDATHPALRRPLPPPHLPPRRKPTLPPVDSTAVDRAPLDRAPIEPPPFVARPHIVPLPAVAAMSPTPRVQPSVPPIVTVIEPFPPRPAWHAPVAVAAALFGAVATLAVLAFVRDQAAGTGAVARAMRQTDIVEEEAAPRPPAEPLLTAELADELIAAVDGQLQRELQRDMQSAATRAGCLPPDGRSLETRVELTIPPAGKPIRARLADDWGDTPVGRCLERAWGDLQLAPSGQTRIFDVTLSLTPPVSQATTALR
jgi:hypothetical protein